MVEMVVEEDADCLLRCYCSVKVCPHTWENCDRTEVTYLICAALQVDGALPSHYETESG